MMKPLHFINLAIFTVFSFLGINAQSLSISTPDSLYLNETSTDIDEEFIHKTYVENVSTDSVSVNWEIDSLSYPNGWSLSLCDISTCLVLDDQTTNTFKLAANAESELKVGYFPNGIAGSSYVKVKVNALGTAEEPLYIVYKTDVDVDIVSNIKTLYSNKINVYPNPATSILNVAIETNGNEDVVVELIDILGRTISSKILTDNVTSFNTSNINKGLYLINAQIESEIISTSTVIVK